MIYMEKVRHLKHFTTVKEFDTYRKETFYHIKHKLSKGAIKVWNVLADLASLRVPGVCWIKIDKIAKRTELSRPTVERAIRLLKKMDVIKIETTLRPKEGGTGANVYIFQKLGDGAEMMEGEIAETPEIYEVEPPKSETSIHISPGSSQINHLNNREHRPYIKFVPHSLQHFQTFVGKHLGDIYSRIWLAAEKLNLSVDKGIMQEIAHIALNKIKGLLKDGKQLNKEDMCRYAFAVAKNQIKYRQGEGEFFWPLPPKYFREQYKKAPKCGG